ncbi:hypothetical protein LZ189_16150, partial [Rhodovulum sulfidophilum]|nr:hypothetical protein [Rhodovulum sulfidophilum]
SRGARGKQSLSLALRAHFGSGIYRSSVQAASLIVSEKLGRTCNNASFPNECSPFREECGPKASMTTEGRAKF